MTALLPRLGRLSLRGWALIVGLGIVVALLTGVLDIRDRILGPPAFAGAIDNHADASDFVRFLEDHDGEPVELDVTCRPEDPNPSCRSSEDESLGVVPDGVETGSQRWYSITFSNDASADVQVDNGPYGAGSLVVKGRFAVVVQPRGDIDGHGYTDVRLRGLSAEAD